MSEIVQVMIYGMIVGGFMACWVGWLVGRWLKKKQRKGK